MGSQLLPVEILKTLSSSLKSEEMKRVWGIQYASDKEQDIAPSIIAERVDSIIMLYEEFPQIAENNKELISFARDYYEYELKALRRAPRKTEMELQQLEQLDLIAGALRQIMPDEQKIPEDKLAEEYQKTLKAVGKQTIQRLKIKTDLKVAGHELLEHFKETAHRFPILTSVTSAVVLPAMFWLGAEGMSAKNAPIQIEAAETCFADIDAAKSATDRVNASSIFDMDSLTQDAPVIQKPRQINAQNCDIEFKSCHDNLKQSLPNTISYLESKGVTIPALPHCTLVNNLVVKAEDVILKADEILKAPYNAVMDMVVDNPIAAIEGQSGVENSYFLKGAKKVSEPLQESIYYANRIENSFHPYFYFMFLGMSLMAVKRAQTMSDEEWMDFKNEMKDFRVRAWNTRKLVYATPLAAMGTYLATHGYDSSGSLVDSNIVAMLSFGAIGGYIAQKVGVNLGGANKRHVNAMFKDVSGSIEKLEANATPLSAQMSAEKKSHTVRNVAIAGAVASYAGVVGCDFAGVFHQMADGTLKDIFTSLAEGAGMLPVSAAIIGGFLPYNFLVEDPAQHVVFMGGGALSGTALGLAVFVAPKVASDFTKKIKDSVPDYVLLSALSNKPSSNEKLNDYIQSKHISKPLSAYHAEYNGYEALTAEQDNNYLYLASDKKPSLAEKMHAQFDGAKECPVIEAQNQNTARKPAAETYGLDLALAK